MPATTLEAQCHFTLALAEELLVPQLDGYYRRLHPTNTAPSHCRYDAAWRDIECGIARDTPGELERGYDALHELAVQVSDKAPQSPLLARIQTTLACEPQMRARTRLQQLDAASIWRSFSLIAECAASLAHEEATDHQLGACAELVVTGGLLRTGKPENVPYPSSPREEKSQRPEANHDSYLMGSRQPTISKIPLQVKMARLSPQVKEWLDRRSIVEPKVRVIEVGPLLRGLIPMRSRVWEEAYGDITQAAPRRRAAVQYMAKLMAREARGWELPSHQFRLAENWSRCLLGSCGLLDTAQEPVS